MSYRVIAGTGIAVGAIIVLAVVFSTRLGAREAAAPQTFVLTAKGIRFNEVNPTLEVRRGVPIEITIRNDEPGPILHDFVVVGLHARTPVFLRPGESAVVRFTPTQTGAFAYVCSLHPGMMDGRLTVRP
jgi:plastocyanin